MKIVTCHLWLFSGPLSCWSPWGPEVDRAKWLSQLYNGAQRILVTHLGWYIQVVEPGWEPKFSDIYSSLVPLENVAQVFHPNSAKISFSSSSWVCGKWLSPVMRSQAFLPGLARVLGFWHSLALTGCFPCGLSFLFSRSQFPHPFGRVALDLGSHSQLPGFGIPLWKLPIWIMRF